MFPFSQLSFGYVWDELLTHSISMGESPSLSRLPLSFFLPIITPALPRTMTEASDSTTKTGVRSITLAVPFSPNRDSIREELSLFGLKPKKPTGDRVSLDLPPGSAISSHRGLTKAQPSTDPDSLWCMIPTKTGESTGVGDKFEVCLVQAQSGEQWPPDNLEVWRALIAERRIDGLYLPSKSTKLGKDDSVLMQGVSRSIPDTQQISTSRGTEEAIKECEYFCSPRFDNIASRLHATELQDGKAMTEAPSSILMGSLESPKHDKRSRFCIAGVPRGPHQRKAVADFVEALLPLCTALEPETENGNSDVITWQLDPTETNFESHRDLTGFKTSNKGDSAFFFVSRAQRPRAKGTARSKISTAGPRKAAGYRDKIDIKPGVLVFHAPSDSSREKSRVRAFTGVSLNPPQEGPISLTTVSRKHDQEWTPVHPLSTFEVPGTQYPVFAWLSPTTLAQLASKNIRPIGNAQVHSKRGSSRDEEVIDEFDDEMPDDDDGDSVDGITP